ncbi:ankyrin repeat-containing domain protein [Dunaliella salina]|uniref:Ankyrin repeat-containing domain protein n=1 Tax=Dunaliella salina TaxID=3046 RepID=A0ABQ7FZ49_DUNSA|nr:ankyrin repeat-containing domain protein [Dunaliella salina]|eukprot:KAF5827616.1 ankyrin repeat-containing domain protein [Dunaliella salina]
MSGGNDVWPQAGCVFLEMFSPCVCLTSYYCFGIARTLWRWAVAPSVTSGGSRWGGVLFGQVKEGGPPCLSYQTSKAIVLTRAGLAQLAAEAASIQRLPEEVLLNVLSYIESPADMSSFSQTCQGALKLASDPNLMAQWLLKHRHGHAMWLAARSPQGGTVMLRLLRLGASATSCSGYLTPLHMAATTTPVQLAAELGYPEVIEHLLGRHVVRADIAAVQEALFAATMSNKVECIQALLTPHSPVSVHTNFRQGVLKPAPRCVAPTPLGVAAYCGNLEAVQVLLSHGAQCAACNLYEWTALHYGCCGHMAAGQEARQIEIVRCLLGSDCSVIDSQNDIGEAPLLVAARTNLPGCCAVLLQAGSQSLHIRDMLGHTLLDNISFFKGEVREVLLQYAKKT